MPAAVIDACCLIDLLASGHLADVLRAAGLDWHLPVAVKYEVQFVRQPDPTDSSNIVRVPVNLDPYLSAGDLQICQPDDEAETDAFIKYASQFRSDGEAMCLTLAELRHWTIATDDRKAIRVARQSGLHVISCPELIKAWADAVQPTRAALAKVVMDIELFAQFRPNSSMPEHQWWQDQLQMP